MYLTMGGLGADPPSCPTDSDDPACIAAWTAYGSTIGTGSGGTSCPGGAASCPGYVPPGSAEWQNSMLQAILTGQLLQQRNTPTNTAAGATTGLSNSTLLLIGGGLLALVVMMTKR